MSHWGYSPKATITLQTTRSSTPGDRTIWLDPTSLGAWLAMCRLWATWPSCFPSTHGWKKLSWDWWEWWWSYSGSSPLTLGKTVLDASCLIPFTLYLCGGGMLLFMYAWKNPTERKDDLKVRLDKPPFHGVRLLNNIWNARSMSWI